MIDEVETVYRKGDEAKDAMRAEFQEMEAAHVDIRWEGTNVCQV